MVARRRHVLAAVVVLSLGASLAGCGPLFGASGARRYRVIAVDDRGNHLDLWTAPMTCKSWSPPCEPAARNTYGCSCERYRLTSGTMAFEWDGAVPAGARLRTDDKTLIVEADPRFPRSGELTMTARHESELDVEWGGTFVVEANGTTWSRGVFYPVSP
ncbi:MAG: hypothetical protein HYV09_15555 [Deltaproteobacteria bacterium]|nr:hypothetical protein [Deltaproteobacteria bacterium]